MGASWYKLLVAVLPHNQTKYFVYFKLSGATNVLVSTSLLTAMGRYWNKRKTLASGEFLLVLPGRLVKVISNFDVPRLWVFFFVIKEFLTVEHHWEPLLCHWYSATYTTSTVLVEHCFSQVCSPFVLCVVLSCTNLSFFTQNIKQP